MKAIHIILFFIAQYSSFGFSATRDDLLRLRETLFSNYTSDVIPVQNISEPITIDTSVFILSMIDFDEVSGIITLSAGAALTWYDYQLVWDPSLYGNIDNMLLNSSYIWKPPIYLVTSASKLEDFDYASFYARVFSTGYVNVSPGILMRSICSVDMTNFPTDSQICPLVLSVWGVSPNEIKLTFNKTEINIDYYSPSGEWDVTRTTVEQYLGYGVPSKTLAFTLYLSRKSAYFVISMLVPIILLCFLNPFVFLLPASSGERISYTITMFLSMAVYMTIIGENIPNVSDSMAGISYFLSAALCFSCLIIILTIFTLRCEAVQDVTDFPRWLVKFVRCFKCKTKSNQIQVKEYSDEHNPKDIAEDGNCKVKKNDVMNCIDLILFSFSMFMITLAIVVFFAKHYKPN